MADIVVPQTSYVMEPGRAYAGMIADSAVVRDIVSRLVETSGGFGAGLFLSKGTDKRNQAILPVATGGISAGLLGVSVFQTMRESTTPRYKLKDSVPVMRKGRIWVLIAANIDEDDDVFIEHSGADAGKIRPTANSGSATAVPNGAVKVIQAGTTTGDGIACVEVNLP